MIKCNVNSMRKLSEFYIVKVVNSYLHLYRCGQHHNHIDIDALAAGTVDVEDDPVAQYLRYYDWSSMR
jgi:hypothetical protein